MISTTALNKRIPSGRLSSKPSTVLILTHRDKKTKKVLTPHLDWLRYYNPDVRIEIIYDDNERDRSAAEKIEAWKNGDKKLRNWWRENGASIDSETLAVFEWDTLMKGELPYLPEGVDLAGKWVFERSQRWFWWGDSKKMDCEPVGLVSFGAFFLKRWVLDAVAKDKWDETYNKDIINELRFSSIARAEGAVIGTMDLPFVHHKEVMMGKELGLYHGVKNKHNIPKLNLTK